MPSDDVKNYGFNRANSCNEAPGAKARKKAPQAEKNKGDITASSIILTHQG